MYTHSYNVYANGVNITVTFDHRRTTLKGYYYTKDLNEASISDIGSWYAVKMCDHFFYKAPSEWDNQFDFCHV